MKKLIEWLKQQEQNFEKCKICNKEWTSKSLKDGVCINCRKNIKIEYAPWIYNKNLTGENAFLKCPRCEQLVDELIYSDYGRLCKQCFLIVKYLFKKEDNNNDTTSVEDKEGEKQERELLF